MKSMHSLRFILQRLSFGLRRKFILFNIVMGIVLISTLISLLSHTMKKYSMDNINEYVMSLNVQISNSIDMYIHDMQKVLMILSEDENLPVISDPKFVGTYEGYVAYNQFYDNIRSLIFFKGYKSLSVVLFDRYEVLTTDLTDGQDYRYFRNAMNNNVYDEIANSKQSMLLLPGFTLLPGKDDNTLFSQAIKLWGNLPGEKDFMVLSADKNLFSNFLNGVNNKAFDDILITTGDGKVIFSLNSSISSYEEIGNRGLEERAPFSMIELNGESFYATINRSESTDWYVISLINHSKVDQQVRKAQWTIIVIGIVIVFIFIVAVNLFVTRSTRDLKRLSKMMKTIESDNYQLLGQIRRNDEIGDLSASFHSMVKSVWENQVLRKEAEVKGLQDQINPHFLYNTLDTISSLALKRDHEKIYETVEKLADFYRYNMTLESNQFIAIGAEIQHVKNYLEIIILRYGNRLHVGYEIEEEVLPYKTIRFMLQPIVENSIKHAFNDRHSNCRIVIKAFKRDKSIVFEVIDNGTGIGDSRLEVIMNSIDHGNRSSYLKSRVGVGLHNVNQRIKLQFGNQYGVSIESEEGKGTTVVVTSPIMD